MTAPSLVQRLREEARLIQYGERACVPGLLHEAADYIAAQARTIELQGNDLKSARAEIERLENRLEVRATDGTYLGIGDCDGIACRDETIRLLQGNEGRLRKDAERYRWMRKLGGLRFPARICEMAPGYDYDAGIDARIAEDAAIDAAMAREGG